MERWVGLGVIANDLRRGGPSGASDRVTGTGRGIRWDARSENERRTEDANRVPRGIDSSTITFAPESS